MKVYKACGLCKNNSLDVSFDCQASDPDQRENLDH